VRVRVDRSDMRRCFAIQDSLQNAAAPSSNSSRET